MSGGTLDGSVGELLELVDEANVPTGQLVPRSVAHAEGLLHRTVYVLLHNSAGDVLLQQRTAAKSICPLAWDVSAAEHVAPGESYEAAAVRGLQEELGVSSAPPLQLALQPSKRVLDYTTAAGKRVLDVEFVPLFTGQYDGPLQPDGIEVASVRWVSWARLVEEATRAPHTFTPWCVETLTLLGRLPARAGAQ